ncbi:MAG: hypothetical protein ABS863_00310 [Aerococcus urinaeequi]
MSIENERKAFEEWAYSNKWNICRYPKSDYHMKEGQYCDEFVDGAWHGWIKSANREGYKLVPVDINENIESAMFSSVAKGDMPRDIYKAMIGACDE